MTLFTKKEYLLLPVLLFFMTVCNKAPEPQQWVFRGQTMGTSYSVKVVTHVGMDDNGLGTEIQAAVDRVDQLMSNWKPDSDVSRFGRLVANQPMDVAPETATVVAISQQISKATSGAFDPTVSPLIELWGFGTRERGQFPDPEKIAAELGHCGYEKISLTGQKLQKNDAKLTLNLGALAKGFALDQVGELLETKGHRNYLVEIGRELKASGENLSGSPWRVAIENPDPNASDTLLRIVALKDKSIATSGDYRQFFEYKGEQYSHIIDPRTGYPIKPRVTLASVIAPTCVQADAWATAFMVLSPDTTLELVEKRQSLECLLVLRSEDGQFSVITSSGMNAYFFTPGL